MLLDERWFSVAMAPFWPPMSRASVVAIASGPDSGSFNAAMTWKNMKLVRSPVVAGMSDAQAQALERRASCCVRPRPQLHFAEGKGARDPGHKRLHEHVPFCVQFSDNSSQFNLNHY